MPQRLMARALDNWRLAERLMVDVAPTSSDYYALLDALDVLRRAYIDLSEQSALMGAKLAQAEAQIALAEELLAGLRKSTRTKAAAARP